MKIKIFIYFVGNRRLDGSGLLAGVRGTKFDARLFLAAYSLKLNVGLELPCM